MTPRLAAELEAHGYASYEGDALPAGCFRARNDSLYWRPGVWEAVIALAVEAQHSKRDILRSYLNGIYGARLSAHARPAPGGPGSVRPHSGSGGGAARETAVVRLEDGAGGAAAPRSQ